MAARVPRGARIIRRATETAAPSPEDFALFNGIVKGGSWEGMQKAVRLAGMDGKLTPGVLGAAYDVFQKCKEKGEDAAVLKTMENVILFMTQIIQQQQATPAVRLIDELMTLNPLAEAEGVSKAMAAAFATAGGVTRQDLSDVLRVMIEGMAEEDEQWKQHVAQAEGKSSKEEFEQIMMHANGRLEAQARLTELKTICDNSSSGSGSAEVTAA